MLHEMPVLKSRNLDDVNKRMRSKSMSYERPRRLLLKAYRML